MSVIPQRRNLRQVHRSRLHVMQDRPKLEGGVRSDQDARFSRNRAGTRATRCGISQGASARCCGQPPRGRGRTREGACCATISMRRSGFPKPARDTGLHVKAVHQMFGPKENPTASSLFEIVAYLPRQEGCPSASSYWPVSGMSLSGNISPTLLQGRGGVGRPILAEIVGRSRLTAKHRQPRVRINNRRCDLFCEETSCLS